VDIGHEKAGWVCQEQVVYVAFEFAAVEPKKEWVADPRDRLVGTRLYRSVLPRPSMKICTVLTPDSLEC
jgi:hypothetical protein